VAHGENREWGAKLDPWRLGGGAAVNPVNWWCGQAGKAALEQVQWWVNPFEAKEGEGLTTGAAPRRQFIERRTTLVRDP
jgi:hypothetical protein